MVVLLCDHDAGKYGNLMRCPKYRGLYLHTFVVVVVAEEKVVVKLLVRKRLLQGPHGDTANLWSEEAVKLSLELGDEEKAVNC